MHKTAVYAKNNRRELWKQANDAPAHFKTFEKMKQNQRKLSREEVVNQCRVQGASKFFVSGDAKVQWQKEIMDYSFKHQFDRVKQRLHEKYLQRYGSTYSVQADPEIGFQEFRSGILFSDCSRNPRQRVATGVTSPNYSNSNLNYWTHRQKTPIYNCNSQREEIKFHDRYRSFGEEDEQGELKFQDRNLPKSQHIKTRKMAYQQKEIAEIGGFSKLQQQMKPRAISS